MLKVTYISSRKTDNFPFLSAFNFTLLLKNQNYFPSSWTLCRVLSDLFTSGNLNVRQRIRAHSYTLHLP